MSYKCFKGSLFEFLFDCLLRVDDVENRAEKKGGKTNPRQGGEAKLRVEAEGSSYFHILPLCFSSVFPFLCPL